MNVVELIRVLQNKIATSTSGEDILYLTKVMEKLNLGMIKTVPSYLSLINLPLKETLGELYFVETDEKVYYRKLSGETYIWVSLFGNEKVIEGAWGWGSNSFGQLGDGTTTARSSPVSVVGGFTDWTQLSASGGGIGGHSLGVRANGTAWGWGNNGSGRLGDNTTTDQSSPVSVVGGFTDWVQLSAGTNHSLGIRSNGTLWAWGNGGNGRLGDSTTVGKSSPVSVVGGFTDWVQVSAGVAHSLGVRLNGTAWGWGLNSNAQLGDGTTVSKNSPVSVVGGFTDWVQVSAGEVHSLGVRANGTAWAWGNGAVGRLGSGTTTNRSSPVSVVGGFTDWTQVNVGTVHSLGVRANGTAWAWGSNGFGMLGDGTTTNRSSPVSIVGGFTDWIQVSAGGEIHSLGVRVNGTAWAWGSNTFGRLGDNTTVNKSSPVSVVGGFTDWIEVSAGLTQSLGLRV
jgi:alpha-tubulin suppressor-like RCC1 family protein